MTTVRFVQTGSVQCQAGELVIDAKPLARRPFPRCAEWVDGVRFEVLAGEGDTFSAPTIEVKVLGVADGVDGKTLATNGRELFAFCPACHALADALHAGGEP